MEMARISRSRTAISNLLLLRRYFSAGSSPLDAAGPLACRLRSRSVIRLRGPDTVKFLHPLLTNEIRHLDTDGGAPLTSFLPTPNINHRSPPPVYAALLTAEGRFLYDLFIYRPPRPDERLDATGSGPGARGEKEPLTLFADVDATFVDELLQLFKKHNLRSKVEIENATDEFSCWQRFGSDTCINGSQESEAASVGWGSGEDLVGEAAAQGNDLGWKWYNDPRLPCLGFRGIFPAKTTPPLVEADKEADERYYLLWRIEKGVAEGPTEIPKGEAIPLEYNLAGLNAISFDKGCYVGQELVARTHHRGVIRKRLFPLKFLNDNGEDCEQTIFPKSDIIDYPSNKKVGTVTTILGNRGMGLLRVEEVMKQSSILTIKGCKEIRVEVIKPDWWPMEWTL